MIAKASIKYLRVSARKVRDVVRLIRGQDVPKAFAILSAVNKGVKTNLVKLLGSAVSNAKKKGLQENQLYISRIVADNGPMYKRYRSAPFGRAVLIRKRTAHVDLELELKLGQAPILSKPKVEKKKLSLRKG